MSGKGAKKLRKALEKVAFQEFKELNEHMLGKSFKYRWEMAWKILFPVKVKSKSDTTSKT